MLPPPRQRLLCLVLYAEASVQALPLKLSIAVLSLRHLRAFFRQLKNFIQEVNVRGSGRFSKSLYFSLSYTFLCLIPLFFLSLCISYYSAQSLGCNRYSVNLFSSYSSQGSVLKGLQKT